ncbi:MAG: hypothetical protein ABIN01_03955 [Ferruginibacter sp.]
MHQELFEKGQQPKSRGLVILKAGKKILSKNQQAFNKLTQKIEKLHKNIEKKQLQFDTALTIYGNEIHPVKITLAGYRRQLVTILWNTYKDYKLSITDQRHLKAILKEHVVELCTQMPEEPDEALKKMFGELEGISIESVLQREKQMMKSEMEEMCADMNIDAGFGDIDANDDKAMAEKMAELQQRLKEMAEKDQEPFGHRPKKRKLTPKQEENERMRQAVEAMKQKNISTIYKQLARLFHPDLEQDEERRAQKEILMKELTAAYEAKNLHALLTLELKWIHKENDHLESLGDEKLAIYLEILREQARSLEQEIDDIYHQPRYQVLVEEFGWDVQRFPIETVKGQLLELKDIQASFKRDLEDFQSPHALRHIKSMIAEWKMAQRQQIHNEEQELLSILFGNK